MTATVTQPPQRGKAFKAMQKVGKAFMLPIAILPAAGLLLGIGGALSNPNTVAAYPVLDNAVAQGIFQVMSDAGAVIFSNLALLLSTGLCIGLAKRDKGTAALAGVVGYLIMTGTTASLMKVFHPDGDPIDTGILGALAIGATAVYLHNRYHNIQLPPTLGFFGGSRFVPIITAGAAILWGSAFFIIWPPIQGILVSAGEGMAQLGVFGTFLYGFLLRLSGALGLHHTIYPMFWYTELGGVEQVAGESVVGAQKIFFAQLADPSHQGLFTSGTRFFAGRFDTMMFGLPGAALAMYHSVPKQRRAKFAGLFLGAALTSFITGITEPLEFMFLFTAPILYVIHAFLDGVSFLIADLLQIRIGNTFSGGVIDYLLFGVIQGQDKTHWMYVIPVGLLWFGIYYVIFRWYIQRFQVATPGRFEDESDSQAAQDVLDFSDAENTPKDVLYDESHQIISALGGADNIEDVDACITRLRVSVKDSHMVDRATLKRLGAADVLDVAGGIQAVYGAKAVLYKNVMADLLGMDD
ncbi:PTS transporter subunit EIIC [Corynebacterium freiburgense]|uniref:PTS transporter subunit EIIC n=1 Tax=Corynebacterium freiburgense TaxID=556548 RepID=UPI0003FC5855|nr:PTS transporter subunit EIIC [Corynebacterium freiburgense]WJZ03351.1 PTS system glucose-specific EIICBA component [Corynebacterium freiburgense]